MTSGIVLAFDTSAAHCAAALLMRDRVLERHEPMEKGQAERLMPLLEEMLAEAGIGWPDIGMIACGTGPGNSTGVRIAVAAARGLALGLGVPAIGVTTFDAAAYGLPRPLAVVEDARRGEVYVQICDPEAAPPCLVAIEHLAGMVGSLPLAGGFAAGAAQATGNSILPQPVALAEAMARIAAARDPADLPRPAPFYLRSADATPPSDPPLVILP